MLIAKKLSSAKKKDFQGLQSIRWFLLFHLFHSFEDLSSTYNNLIWIINQSLTVISSYSLKILPLPVNKNILMVQFKSQRWQVAYHISKYFPSVDTNIYLIWHCFVLQKRKLIFSSLQAMQIARNKIADGHTFTYKQTHR